MKIAIITERSDVTLGGAERSVFELSSALMTKGLDITLLAAKGSTNVKHAKALCDNIPSNRISLPLFANALSEHFKKNQYDIIHSVLPFDFADIYQPRGGSYLEAIIQNSASCENRLIAAVKQLTSFLNFRRAALAKEEKKICLNDKGPCIAALSKYVAEQFKRHYNLDDSRIVIIQNGVKTDRPVDEAEFAAVKNRILDRYSRTSTQRPVFFLFAANNFRLKGLTPLLKSIKIAHTLNPSAPPHFFVAGSGSAAPYYSLAKSLGIEHNVSFLGRAAQIQNILAISDVAVLPTFYDPASRFILEALAMAKPVITTSFNGAADLFANNRHGIVIQNPSDIHSLASAIVYFCDQTNIKNASDAIIADELKQAVSIERHIDGLVMLYETIYRQRSNK